MSAHASHTRSAGKPHWARRRYMINAVFQWKYTFFVIIGVFFTSAVLSSVLFGILHKQARQSILNQTNPEALPLWENVTVVFLAAGAFATVLSIAFGFWTLIITHRIYGPVFVLERFVGELADGRFPKYRPLRKKDEFKGFYDAFWRAVDALKWSKRVEVAALTEAIRVARSGLSGDDEQRQRAMKTLVGQLETLRKQTVHYLGEEEAAVILEDVKTSWQGTLKRREPVVQATS